MSRRRFDILAVLGAAALLGGCEDHSVYLAHEPPPHEWGTFGEELFRLVLGAAAASSDGLGGERSQALAERRAPLVEAIDLTLPEPLYQPARDGLAATLERVDDGTLPRLTRSGGELAGDLAEDAAALEAMVDLRDQPWTAGRRQVYDLARQVASASEEEGQEVFVPLVATTLRLAREHDGLGDDGAGRPDEPAELRELLRAASRELEAIDLEDAEEALPLGASLPERLVAGLGIPFAGDPVWVVQADPRGLPRVRIDPARGTVYQPFVDADRDGLADVDQEGRLVDPAGQRVDLPPYGDDERHASDGRALAYDGAPIFEYVDFSRSAGGVVLRGARSMVEEGAHDELGLRVERLLGPRAAMQDSRDGAWYRGFSRDRIRSTAPAFDLLWAVAEAVREHPPDRLLYGTEALVRERRGEVRRLLEEAMEAVDVVDEVGLGELAPANSLLDDLLVAEQPPGAVCYGPYDEGFEHSCVEPPGPLVPRLIETGILRDLMEVLDDERLDLLADAMATMMRHRDRLSTSDMTFDVPVAPDEPESEVNRSTFQRLMHLVHDANDAHFDTWLGDIGLSDWRIDNLAVFYLETYCGEATLPSGLHHFMSEFSSDRPTTEEVTRFIVSDQSGFPVFANPTGREGRELWTYNADTLLAVEASGLMEALQPIVQVFCDHGELLLFANLLSVVHEHFSTLPEYTTEMTGRFDFYGVERPAELRAVEEGLAEAVMRTELFDAFREAGIAGTEITVDGEPIVEPLIDFVAHLLDTDATVVLRAHEDPSRDGIYRYDRLEEARRPSHANVLYQRLAEVDDAWDGEDPTVREELEAISGLLSDHYLDLPDEGETHADEAEYLVHLLERALPRIAEWTEDNLDDGDAWGREMARARGEVDDLEEELGELLEGPLLPALVDVVAVFREDGEAREGVRDLLLHLLTPPPPGGPASGGSDPFAALARVLAAAVQMAPARQALEGVLRFVGRLLDPVGSSVASAPGDLALLTDASPTSVALLAAAASLAEAVGGPDDGRPPLAVVAEALAAIGRVEPGAEGPLAVPDLASLLGHAVHLLTDTDRGLERIYAIVGERVREGEGPEPAR